MRAFVPLMVLACLLPARGEAAEVTRTTDPPMAQEAMREGWAGTGFRIHIQVGWNDVVGRDLQGATPPAGSGLAFAIRPGAKVDPHLELSAGLRYALFKDGTESWLRFSLTADAAYYFTPGLFAGLGMGYGGMWNSAACRADGPQALVRAGGLYMVGDLLSMGPVVEADVALSSCNGSQGFLGRWLHDSLALYWSFTWR